MFKKINLLTDKVVVPNSEFAKALNSNREFGITVDGVIDYEFQNDRVYIFKGKANLLQKQQPLGKGYDISSTFVSVSISVAKNWNRVEELNSLNALYEDKSADGIDSFRDKVMEDIGWHAVEFKITYRDLVDELEAKGEGTLVCIEQDGEPYMFSGFAFIDPDRVEDGREILLSFAKRKILEQIESEKDEYKKYGFSDDEVDALKYFQIEPDLS